MNAQALDRGDSRVVLEEGQRRDNWSEASVQDYLNSYQHMDRRKEMELRTRIQAEKLEKERDQDEDGGKKKASKLSVRQQEIALPDDVKLRNQAKAIEQQLGTGNKYGWLAQGSNDSIVPVLMPSVPQQSRPKVPKKIVAPSIKITVDDALFVVEKDAKWKTSPVVEKWKIWKNWDWVDGGQAFNSAESTMAQSRKRKAADE
jgi:hypothetical protein